MNIKKHNSYALIQCALSPEAQPLIKTLKLKKILNFPRFELFHKDNIFLLISSAGKIKAAASLAAAITYLEYSYKILASKLTIINIGIAGSNTDIKIGTLCHALKVTDAATNIDFYPDQLIKAPGQPVNIYTFDCPVFKNSMALSSNAIVDMEAASIFEVAKSFGSSSRVQALKIVSDHLSPFDFKSQDIFTFIEQHLEQLIVYINNLISDELVPNSILNNIELEQIDTISKNLKLTNSQVHDLMQRAKYHRTVKTDLPDLKEFYSIVPTSAHNRKIIFEKLRGLFV